MDRRTFVSAAALAAASAGSGFAADRARTPLRILVLGGTRFIGIHMTELALRRGHQVTLFNRGRSNTELFPEVERLQGDRNGKLESLAGRKWDAVIDNSGYVPREVRLSAELLAPNVGQYVFVSSVSVYPDLSVPRDERSPVGELKDATVEKVDAATYGPLKALCEQAVEKAMPGRVTVLRPGLIVGPYDITDRFTWWPARAARGGEFLAPGSPSDHVQVVDARDLAAFALDAIEKRTHGVFNVISPPGMFTIGSVVESSVAAASELAKPAEPPQPTWVPAAFLATQQVQPWSEMPAWVPAEGEEKAFAETSVARALKAGLKIRPLATTTRDTLAWHLKRPEAERSRMKSGIEADKERAVLAAWHAAQPRSPAGVAR